jgi:HEAT repeat protein
MSIEHKKSLPLALMVFGVMLAVSPFALAEGEMSAAEVWELLPKGIDAEDDDEIANYVKLVEQGEAIYGALLDIVRANNDPLIAGRALSVLRASKSDNRNARRDAVAELGRILYEKRDISDEWESWTLSLMAEAIADMGEAGDSELLAPLLNHPSGDVRSAGYSGMEKLAAKAVESDSPEEKETSAQSNDDVSRAGDDLPTEAGAVGQAKKTYRDYPEWCLLPKSIDLEDENVLAAFQRLVDEGEAAHEAMVAIAKECENSMIASYALSVLRESSGDKREAVAELKQFFAARFPNAEGEEVWRMTFIAETLADIGTEDDVTVLAPMLTHPNMRVRYLGAQYLGQRGGQQAMEALERAKGRESNNLVLDEMNKAVTSITGRLAAQNAEASPSP